MIARPMCSLRFVIAVVLLATATVLGTTTPANAANQCGEHSFSFEGTRLLNDGISDSAGPFVISMPAGTYDITMHSFDDHAAHPGQFEQTQEQWYFTLDSGYTSPVSSDIPDAANSVVDVFEGVTIGPATAITVRHLGEAGINSVAPSCVGFTTVPLFEPRPAVIPLVTVIAGPQDPGEQDIETSDVSVEVQQATEVAVPPVVLAASVPAAAPQLAITGPSAQMSIMVIVGSLLLVIGGALLVEAGRQRSHSG